MSRGYYAIGMNDRAIDYTTCCTTTQKYRFLVMPFGLKIASAKK